MNFAGKLEDFKANCSRLIAKQRFNTTPQLNSSLIQLDNKS